MSRERALRAASRGFSIVELVVVCAILTILAGVAMPVVKFTRQRLKEDELRQDLREMRAAIDEYKRYADAGFIPVDFGTDGYPKDLASLVDGVDVIGQIDMKVKFLRRIPVDPFTGEAQWGLHSFQDEPDASSWGGEDVYDVFSLASGTGLNGIPYSKW